ncbi:MAG: hypothetical protein KGZ80_04265 [Methylomonas sp.]|nr:hypothetical protein [Methylomonas sp.]
MAGRAIAGQAAGGFEIELRERMVRVEEALKNQGDELKAQRELIYDVMKQMDKQFAQSREESNKRFEEMGRRLDRFMFWSLGLTVTAALFVVTYLK